MNKTLTDTTKITPEVIDHYIYEARRMRSQAFRDFCHATARWVGDLMHDLLSLRPYRAEW